jgi:hypothetical protein
MCSINHDKKSIFIHNPKTGGTYIRENLEKYYGFKFHVIKRPDHDKYCNSYKYNGSKEFSKFVANREHGILKYAKTSNYINRMINMNNEKWNSYTLFCFVRNPYDRLISGWNYLNSKHNINIPFNEYIYKECDVSDFEYVHSFMSQYNHMIDENNNFSINLLGKFENIEEDFKNILSTIGFNENEIIHAEDKKNNFSHESYKEIINNQEILDRVNIICNDDFKNFHYRKIEKIEDFPKSNDSLLRTLYYKKYLELDGNLLNYVLLEYNFYYTKILFPELNCFNDNFELIKNELTKNINIMKDWLLKDNNHKFYSKHTIIPIYGYKKWSKYALDFPETVNLIRNIKNIDTLCFLKLARNTRLNKHYGYNPSSNYILRSHLGINVPNNCGMWVNGEIKLHKEKEWLTFDDSKLHSAFNNSNEDRYIMLVDIKRPDFIKIGSSLREDNYDELIEDFISENI